jgi:hypothetical protein
MKRIVGSVLLVLFLVVAAIGQDSASKHVRQGFGTPQIILNVLTSTRASASLEYNRRCGPNVLFPDLPPIREPQRPNGPTPADTLRSMFSVDSGIVISQDRAGIIRVVKAGVQTDILEVKIHHLSFDGISDPDYALHVVLDAPEIQSFIKAHGIGQPFDVYHPAIWAVPGPKASPMPGVPRISGELKEVRLSDALDYILKTYPGFWLYQDCKNTDGRRVVYFGLFPVPGTMWLWENDSTSVR